MKKHIGLLGHKVSDPVTGITGIVSSISFDVSGCIQAAVRISPKKEGGIGESFWIDTKQLKRLTKTPVVKAATFDIIPGSQMKPAISSHPAK
jgi:hypothetical protein